jgi:molecular chaperone IbpA
MRTFDFAPLYRSTVGFDRMFSVLDHLDGLEGSAPSYPPYNIERNGENAFRISVAVAGFTNADLSIDTKENTLTIHGEKQATDEEKRSDVLYKGIAERAFQRSFQLADHVVVRSAKLANGLYAPETTTWVKIKNPVYSQAEGRADFFNARAAGA